MARLSPYPAETRRTVETMLREGRLRPAALAARTGVPRTTICTWRAQLSPRTPAPRRPKPPSRAAAPARLTMRQRAALARLLPLPGLDLRDLGQAIGLRRKEAVRAFAEAGLRRPGGMRTPAAPPAPAVLDAALRAHVARQIARFDASLTEGDASLDSARVLRDLSGLRRLIDDMGRRRPLPDGDANAGPVHDLAECRARLARRLATLGPGALAERLSREPDGARPDPP